MYHMELLNSAIIIILIALIWTAIIFLSFKRMVGQQNKRDKKMLLGGLLLFVALATLFVVVAFVYEEVESPGFCGTFCHVMNPYYEDYIHPGDNEMMAVHVAEEVTCSNCHNEPGIVGTIEGLAAAVPEAIIYFTNSYDVDDLGGDVSRAACLKCHDGSIAIIPGEVTTAIDTIANPHNDEKKCTECHNPHLEGSGLGNEACSVCHGTEIDDFEEKLIAHSDRVEEDCMSCHNREHPENAMILFSEFPSLINEEFCSDCHIDDLERLNEKPHKSKTCTDCHDEHDSVSIQFSDCNEPCHNPPSDHDTSTSNCSVCHDTTKIHLISADLGEFSDIICSNCHEAENTAFESSFTPRSLEIYGENGCVDCHSEHQEINYPHITTTPFDNCESCHNTYNKPSTVHDRTEISYTGFSELTDEFCSECHSNEYSSYTSSFTDDSLLFYGENGCIDCHSEHEAVSYPHRKTSPYDVCSNCHNSYDQETTVHDRTELSYLGFSDLENDFCSDCHTDEFESFGVSLHSARDCADCHSDHKIRVEFEECDAEGCHEQVIIDYEHDTSMNKCIDTPCHSIDIDMTLIHSG